MGIKIDPDSKSLMVAGDPECIVDLLLQMFDYEKKAT